MRRETLQDFLLLSDTGLTVVDVKPRLQLSKPKVSFTLAWTKEVVERRSWRYEVWGEPPEAELGNLRSLEMPLSEDALAFARKLAASNHRYPDDRIAVADLLERWKLGLATTPGRAAHRTAHVL